MKVRVDLGRVLPGVLLLAIGGVLFVALLLLAAFSFLFSFIGFWNSVMYGALWLLFVPALIMVAGGLTIFSGLAWWGTNTSWFEGWWQRRARLDRIRLSQRFGELFGVAVTILVFAFLYENQLRGAAFFTSSFGTTAQLLFYGPLFTGALLSAARAIYGRRNGVRPFDSVNALFLTVSALWLLSAFPFDFTRAGEMFPAAVQFIFWWVNNDVGRFLFFIAGVASMVNFVYTTVLYAGVRNQLAHIAISQSR